jgi:hypothetical protein
MRINNRPSKQTDRGLFLALQADAKDYPGGIRALAEMLGVNGNTLGNGLNPDHDAQPPSFALIVEIIKTAQAKRTVFALSQIVGQVPMDFELENNSPAEAVRLFLTLMHTVGEVLGKGSDAAKDGRFDADERRMLEPLLLGLMKSAGELLQSVRG